MDNLDRDIDILLEGFIKDKIGGYISNIKKKIADKKAAIAAANRLRIQTNYRQNILRLPIDISGDLKYLMKDAINNALEDGSEYGINDMSDDSWVVEHTALMYACLRCKDILKPDEIASAEKAERMYNQLIPRVESAMMRAAKINGNNKNMQELYRDFKNFKDNAKTCGVKREVGWIREYLADRD